MPRRRDFFITNSLSPSYSLQPRVATITFWPAATLGAPHTICDGSPLPMFTVHTCMWSLSGCGSHVSTSPTTSPASPPFIACISSTEPTSRPIEVSASAVSCGVRLKSTYSLSHLYDMFIVPGFNISRANLQHFCEKCRLCRACVRSSYIICVFCWKTDRVRRKTGARKRAFLNAKIENWFPVHLSRMGAEKKYV